MTTKFILHGGRAQELSIENDEFFREILKDLPNKPRILLVFFAKPKEEYPKLELEVISQFERNRKNKELSFEIASESNFEEQIKLSDVIYFRGGKSLLLLEALKKYPNLRELFYGKVIAGESAGAHALSTYFYSKSEKEVFEGLGFVPVKMISHYTGENKEKLDEYSKNLKTLLLPEFKYKVFSN